MSPMQPFDGFNFMFSAFPVIFVVIFLVILGVIVAGIAGSLRQNAANRRQPVLSVTARVLARRTDVTSHHDASPNDGMNTSHVRTSHYATFEVESGDRMEFLLPGTEYGLLLEGDYGKLTFQGTRYLGFVRDTQPGTARQAGHPEGQPPTRV